MFADDNDDDDDDATGKARYGPSYGYRDAAEQVEMVWTCFEKWRK